MKRERGITLIALIITIIILIILTAVAVGTVNQNKLMDLTTGAVDSYNKGEVEERFRVAEATILANAAQEGRNPTMDEYIEGLGKQGIIDPNQVTENEDGSKEVVTPDGWTARVIPDENGGVKDVEIEGRTDDLPVYITKLTVTSEGTESIKAEIKVIRGENAKYTYSYKEGTINEDGEYKEAAKGITDLSYTIKGLKQETVYTIKVEATDDKGTSVKYATAKTGAIGNVEGVITLGDVIWKDGVASVSVVSNTNKDSSLKMKYDVYNDKDAIIEARKDQDIQVGETIGELYLGYTVRVRLTDGTNYSIDDVSETIIDLDKPNKATIAITEQPINDWYKTNITITINAGKDEESGANKIRYEVTGDDVQKGTTEEGELSKQISITKDGTSTIKVYTIDKAGNESEENEIPVNKDALPPNPPTISYTGTKNGADYKTDIGVTINAGVDIGNSGAYQVEYSITGPSGFVTQQGTTQGGTTQYETTLTIDGTYTINAYTIDKAGNKSTVKTEQVTKKSNSAPEVATISSDKTYDTSTKVHAITITATGTDAEGGELTYTLTYGTQNGVYNTPGGSLKGQAGQPVTFTINQNLVKNTIYYYKVDVKDSEEMNGTPKTGSQRTYCIGEHCDGSRTVDSICPSCGGNGYKSCTGTLTYINTFTEKAGSRRDCLNNCGRSIADGATAYGWELGCSNRAECGLTKSENYR